MLEQEIEKYYRRNAVLQITGFSRSLLYSEMDEGRFPRPVKIAARAVAWRESDIAAWQAQRSNDAT